MLKSILYCLSIAFVLQSCSEAKESNQVVETTEQKTEVKEERSSQDLIVEKAVAQIPSAEEQEKPQEMVNKPEVKEVAHLPKSGQTVPATSAPVASETPSQDEPEQVVQQPETVETVLKPDHGSWDALLKKYVSANGQVNYKGFKADRNKLDQYLADLKSNPIKRDWSRNEKLAYWTNAYNAFTIDLIVRNYPLKSIMDLDKPWDKKFIEIAGKSYSLNQIEHEVVRPTFKDPRIHFAFVCAAKSCPKLLNAAYLPETIQSQFDRQTKHFINQSGKNQISPDVAKVSQLFNWYGDDFKATGSVIDFLNKYTSTKIKADAKVEFLEYDWALNE